MVSNKYVEMFTVTKELSKCVPVVSSQACPSQHINEPDSEVITYNPPNFRLAQEFNLYPWGYALQ